MATSTERALPIFKESDIAEEAAKVTILAGGLLQDKTADVYVDFSVRGDDKAIYFGPKSDAQSLHAFSSEGMVQFLLKHPQVLDARVECRLQTFPMAVHAGGSKETLVLDENGDLVRITEEQEKKDGDFTQTNIQPASIEDVIAMAKEMAASADVRPDGIEPERTYAKTYGGSADENLYIAQASFIPILGRLAAIAGVFALNRKPDTSIDAEVKLSTCHYRMYAPYSHWDKVSNRVHISGVNRSDRLGATFECEAYPLHSSDLAIVKAHLLVDERGHDDGLHLTKDTVVSGESLKRRRRTKVASEEPQTVGEYPADLNTIIELAEKAVQLVRSEE